MVKIKAMEKTSAELNSRCSVLLSELNITYQRLEELFCEHKKNHKHTENTFQKAIHSALKKKQEDLIRIEEEEKRLRDQVSTIMESNYLALQHGEEEINCLVQEIVVIESKLTQALETSGDSEAVAMEFKERVSNVLQKKKFINTNFKKVDFIPYPLASTLLGKILCEEQTVELSIPCPTECNPASCAKDEENAIVLNDGNLPWEATLEKSEEVTLCKDENDQDSGPSIPLSCPREESGTTPRHQKVALSSKEQEVIEADGAGIELLA